MEIILKLLFRGFWPKNNPSSWEGIVWIKVHKKRPMNKTIASTVATEFTLVGHSDGPKSVCFQESNPCQTTLNPSLTSRGSFEGILTLIRSVTIRVPLCIGWWYSSGTVLTIVTSRKDWDVWINRQWKSLMKSAKGKDCLSSSSHQLLPFQQCHRWKKSFECSFKFIQIWQ